MAYRADISINWYGSPRIIEVASPSVELTMQDLHDTLRAHEDDLVNMGFPKIVSSSGKEVLDATTKVGVTVTLQNAQVSFQARPGPTWTLCNLIGGNLVAVDTDGATPIDSVFPTAFVSVAKTSSASATLQEQDALQYSSFGGEVSVDTLSVISGTTFPAGSQEFPVNNIPDAVAIAYTRGFTVISVRGDLTLDTGDDVRGFHIHGKSHVNSVLAVNPGALCLDTQFSDFDITGTLDGNSEIRQCVVRDMLYFNGHIHDSSLAGTLTLAGSQNAHMTNCKMYNILATPIIDCGGSGQNVAMSNYSGRILVTNLNGASELGIGLDAGQVEVDASCVAGIIAVSGSGSVIDNSAAGCYVVDTVVDGVKLDNLKREIEYLRPHHTGSGFTYYWNPVDGDDTFDGRHQNRALKTFAAAHAKCLDGHHDIIMAVSSAVGVTVSNENITISKNYTFLRGPGRDFEIKSLDDNTPAITITSEGVEVSGMKVSTSATSNVNAVYSTGDFTLLNGLYLLDSGNGIELAGGEYGVLKDVKSHHNAGYGIKISGTATHVDIRDCHVGSNAGDGILVDNTGGHEVNLLGNNIIHANGGYGLNITANSSGVNLCKGTALFNNTAGDLLDNGTATYDGRVVGGGGSLTQDQSDLLDRTAYIEAKVYINTELVAPGDGSQATPFNDFNTGKDYAEANGIRTLVFLGTTTITSNCKNFIVEGLGVATINLNGQDCNKTKFFQCTLSGVYLGTIIAQDCILEDGTELDGFFEKCMLNGTVTCRDGSEVLIANCFSGIPGILHPIISMNGIGSSKLSVRNYSGGLELADCNGITDEVTLEVSQGSLTLANTCTNGVVVARGVCKFVDNSGAGCTVVDETVYNHIVDIDRLVNYNEGTWRIIADQMIYYNTDGSEFMRFDLLDSAGQPISRGAMQRVKV